MHQSCSVVMARRCPVRTAFLIWFNLRSGKIYDSSTSTHQSDIAAVLVLKENEERDR